MFKTFPIVLDVTKHQLNDMFQVNSNDLNTVRLNLSIKSGLEIFDLTGKIVRIAIKKPDGFIAFQTGGVTDPSNGLCEFILDRQAYLVEGKHEAEVMIYQDDSTVIVTERFYYKVNRAIVNDKTLISTNHLPAINQAIIAGEQLKDIDIPEFVEAANSAYETIEEAETQGLYAKGQGDYAKQEADRAAARVTELNGVDAVQFKGRQDQFDVSLKEKAKKGEDVPVNVKDFGAIGDGLTHPLSQFFPTLALAQMKYPFVTALTQETDWAGIQLALNSSKKVRIPKGKYLISDTLVVGDFTVLTLEGSDTRYNTGEENVAVLSAKANVRLMELGDACQVLGGKLTAIDFSGYDKSMIYIDFSTKNRSDIHIETSLRGRSAGNAIEIYGNGDGGTAHPIFINSNIMNFDIAVKGMYAGGTCWCTGINVDSTITNCVQSVYLDNVGSGGDLLGSYQPTFTGTKTDRGVVELKNTGSFNIHAKIWDMNQAINNYSIVLRNSTENDISRRIDHRQILNLSKKPLFAPINNIFPSGAFTFFDRIQGNYENVLFGANSKYTVNITAGANITNINNINYDPYGMFKMEGKPTYLSLASGAATPTETVQYEILFTEATKRIQVAGFSFWSHVPPASYQIHVKELDNTWTLIDSGIPYDKIHNSGGIPDTAISTRITGDQNRFVNGIRFTFEVSKTNVTVIDSVWAKSGNQNEAYLPIHGGKIHGDVEYMKSTAGTIMKSPDGSRFRLTIGNDGAITTTKL